MSRTMLLIALTAATPSVWAQQPLCRADGNQQEMNQCAFDALGEADAQLNATYTKVLASLEHDPLARERVKAAQRLWLQLRDADLAAQFPLAEGKDPRMQYGSIYPLEHADAQADLTRQRTDYLRRQFLAPLRDKR